MKTVSRVTVVVGLFFVINILGCNLLGFKSAQKNTSELTGDSSLKYTFTHATGGYSIKLPADSHLCYATESGQQCNTDFITKDVVDLQGNSYFVDSVPTFDIVFFKNGLNMSAVDFAKKLLFLNRKYRNDGNYTEEKDITVNGVAAYSFIAKEYFEQRGISFNENNVGVDDKRFYQSAGYGTTLNEPHRIIYLDFKGRVYRIIYPVNNSVAESMVKSIKFLNE